jgi:hypothetical protein
MTEYETWTIIINAIIAFSLFCLIIVALFGNQLRRWLFPARLTVEILDKDGELTILDNGHRVIYYHLRIINTSNVIVNNCRVFLTKIMKFENGNFKDIPFSVPLRYAWSPAETSPEGVDIVTERIADFGYVIETSTEFKPTVTPILNSFRGNLKHHETFRYYIELIAENYRPRKLIGIEITWDGIWPEDMNEMHQHLKISRI